MRNRIRLSEGQLRRVVMESVYRILEGHRINGSKYSNSCDIEDDCEEENTRYEKRCKKEDNRKEARRKGRKFDR